MAIATTQDELIQRLAEPFSRGVINWKPQVFTKDKSKAMAVPFIDARDLMKRLDEVCGPWNWQVKPEYAENGLISNLGIKNPETGEWIWKGDVGFVAGEDSDREDSQVKAVKGSGSDALKRAAVVWGVFRYAYDIPQQWVAWDVDGKKFATIPTLPDWALPENERSKKPAPKAAPAPAAPTAAPAGTTVEATTTPHWIDDENNRKKFWAKVKDLGLDEKGVHNILGVQSMRDYKGTGTEAIVALTAHVQMQPA